MSYLFFHTCNISFRVFVLYRWIRDHLLTFQDMVSSYNTHLRKQFSSLESANHEPSATQIVVDDDEEELDEEELHMRKVMADMRQEVIAQRKQNIALLHAASSTSSSSHQEIPSFDEYVRYVSLLHLIFFPFTLPYYLMCDRYLLLPVWLECRRCTQLEYVLSFASIIVETLSNVHEQIERRTYGADHLKKTIQSWEILIKQIRVVLFLKSRMYRDNIANASADQAQYNNTSIASLSISLYTVENMSEGKLSLGRILAMDTLEFALRADQAIEHEERCREVYHKRKASLLSAPGGNAAAAEGDSNNASKSEVLLAWGPVADRRWRDILSVAVMEDSLDASSTPAGSGALDSATSMNKDTSPGKLFIA